jgi:hypothetical protein
MSENLEFAGGLPAGAGLGRAKVSKMVRAYREKTAADAKALRYVHLRITDVLALLFENKIIDLTVPLEDQKEHLLNFGLKLYPAVHVDAADCPGYPEYVGFDTIVMCNTVNEGGAFRDMLADGEEPGSWVETVGGDTALDVSKQCPPFCDDDDDDVSDGG